MLMISLQVAEPFRGPREVNGRGCEDALCRIGANEPWVIRLRPTYKFTLWGRETIFINIMVTRNLTSFNLSSFIYPRTILSCLTSKG